MSEAVAAPWSNGQDTSLSSWQCWVQVPRESLWMGMPSGEGK